MAKEDSLAVSASSLSLRLISRTPGRLRLRLLDSGQQSDRMDEVAGLLTAHPLVHRIRTNRQTGSITIFHQLDDESVDDTFTQLQNFNVNVIQSNELAGRSATATGIVQAVSSLNQRVKRATHGSSDLRVLVPALLAAIALRQLFSKSKHLKTAPWYVLAWYAFDSFMKLHDMDESPSPKSLHKVSSSCDSSNGSALAQAPQSDGRIGTTAD